MANNKHLTLDERTTIESMLKLITSFTEIGNVLDKDPSTISKGDPLPSDPSAYRR